MADHGMLVECGMVTGQSGEGAMGMFQEVLGALEAIKNDGLIEEYRWYINVTGNRSQRALTIVLETDSAGLEKLVGSMAWVGMLNHLSQHMQNVTVTRLLFGDRLMELMKQAQEAGAS